MPVPDNHLDANFYQLVHQLMSRPRADNTMERTMERRTQSRRRFLATQRIAPHAGPGVPKESEFFEVQCYDLNRRGFSFLLPERPDFKSLVVSFETPSGPVYMAAEVSHCESVSVYPSGVVEPIRRRASDTSHSVPDGDTGIPMVLAGCRFVQRLTP